MIVNANSLGKDRSLRKLHLWSPGASWSPPLQRSSCGQQRPRVCWSPGCVGCVSARLVSTSTDFTGHQLKPVRALPNPPFRRPVGRCWYMDSTEYMTNISGWPWSRFWPPSAKPPTVSEDWPLRLIRRFDRQEDPQRSQSAAELGRVGPVGPVDRVGSSVPTYDTFGYRRVCFVSSTSASRCGSRNAAELTFFRKQGTENSIVFAPFHVVPDVTVDRPPSGAHGLGPSHVFLGWRALGPNHAKYGRW